MAKVEKQLNVQEDGKEEATTSWWSWLIGFCFESRCMEIHVKMEKFVSMVLSHYSGSVKVVFTVSTKKQIMLQV